MSKEEKAKEYAGISKIMIFDTKRQERVKIKYNAYIAGYTQAEQDLSSQLTACKDALDTALTALNIIANGDPISVGLDEITEIAQNAIDYCEAETLIEYEKRI